MADVREVELLVLESKDPKPSDDKGKGWNGMKLRVVQWVFSKKDGSEGHSESLEKRETYLTEDGELRNGKAKGFTLKDMEVVKKQWPEIIRLLKNPPAVQPEETSPEDKTEEGGAAASAQEDLEEVPF